MKNILIVSNSDTCRSRMAQEILNSFGRGMKISTAGVLVGNSVPDVVCQVMEQNGYDFSRRKPCYYSLSRSGGSAKGNAGCSEKIRFF